MARDKSVMFALIGLGKTGKAPELAERGKQLLPPGQGLVNIALVAHIEHQPVRGGVEHPVDGHRQFHCPQIGGQVSAGLGYAFYQKRPQLLAELWKLVFLQRLHIGGRMDAFQNHICCLSL